VHASLEALREIELPLTREERSATELLHVDAQRIVRNG